MFWWTVLKLKFGKDLTRHSAAVELGRSGNPRAVGPLISALKDKYSLVRMQAAEALERIGKSSAVEPLIAALKDESYSVMQAVAEALKSLCWQPTDDTQEAYYAVALKDFITAKNLGVTAVEPLISYLPYHTSQKIYSLNTYLSGTHFRLGTSCDGDAGTDALEWIVKKDIKNIRTDCLLKIANVRDFHYGNPHDVWYSGPGYGYRETKFERVYCSQIERIKKLVLLELNLRDKK